MSPAAIKSQRGSLVLVVLCFVAVLGIALVSYVSLGSRAMQLSNRAVQSGLSKQIAESAVEEALRALSKNDWSGWSSGGVTVTWSDNGTAGKKATISFPASKFGQGVTASAKIRIDNANYATAGATWNSSANYRTNDLISNNGVWYRCVLPNSNQTPTSTATNATSTATFWIEDQMPLAISWGYPILYRQESVVFYNGSWYRCTAQHTSSASILPTNTSYWTSISVITTSVSTSSSNNESLLHYWSGATWAWWRYNFGWDSAPAVSWRWRGSYSYVVDDVVAHNGIWYRCTAPTSSTSSPAVNTACWSSAPSTSMWAWSSSSFLYNLNDVVSYSGRWYRCILAHTSSGSILPTNTTYWSSAPKHNPTWSATRQYSQNDTVYYNGVWYLSLQASNIGNSPTAGSSTYWVGANTTNSSYIWNRSTSYSAGDYRAYGGAWYRCTSANTGQSPNNSASWTASWANGWNVTTGAPVIYAEGTIDIAGNRSARTQIRALVAPAAQFPNAVAANASTITANSGGTVDSYDSTQGAYGGTNIGFSAVIASTYSAGTAITLSSTTVKGYLAAPSSSTTPFAPLYSSGGTVKGPSSPNSPNIDLSRVSRTPYVPKFDTIPGGAGGVATNWSSIPKGTALTLSSTTNIGIPGGTTPLRYNVNGNLTIGGPSIQYLNINGPVILFINGDLAITNSSSIGRINISSTGSAEIHVSGALKVDAPGDGFLSSNTDPKSLIIISDTTSTTTQFYSEGVNPLYGVVYLPYSTSTNGFFNDNTNTNIYGAISANKVTYSGANMNVHYDTSLRYATFGGVEQPFAITQWRELTDPVELATMP
jgi:hypothetical protein